MPRRVVDASVDWPLLRFFGGMVDLGRITMKVAAGHSSVGAQNLVR